MPNGGSDCCGTCPFNSKNKGEAGYGHSRDPGPASCVIRDGLEIPDPFWTYCANHPHRNPSLLRVPLGPVFRSMEDDPPEGEDVEIVGDRWVWRRSHDTPAVREALLKILADAAEGPTAEYPLGVSLTEAVIWQLAEFREQRAVPHLKRIALASGKHDLGDFAGSHVARLGPLAAEALRRIAQQ